MANRINGKAPLRISFAGGGTDLNHVFEKYGGAVINATIDKFTHATIQKRKDKQIFINKISLKYSDKFTKTIIKKIKPKIGFDLYYRNDIPSGRGLASSSAYAVLITKLIKQLEGIELTDKELVNLVYGIENEVGVCGWQDQYATTFGGFNFMQFNKNKTIYPLRLKSSTIRELENNLVLVYTKKSHNSFQIDIIGSDGNPMAGASKTFTAGSNLTIGDDFAWYTPQSYPTYAVGVRVTNLGTVNHTITKIEIDVDDGGK